MRTMFENFIEYFLEILPGLPVTLLITSLSLMTGLILAFTFLLIKVFTPSYVSIFFRGFASLFRSTPLLLQMFFFYYGIGMLVSSKFLGLDIDAFWYGYLALSLNSAAYTFVVLEGGVNSVSKSHIESGKSLGMSKHQIFKRIILPQAWGYALPAYGNEMILLVKCSSLISTITIMDITGYSVILASDTYDIIKVFLIGGMLYLMINTIFICIIRFVEFVYSRKFGIRPT